jgi:hypothetical protein
MIKHIGRHGDRKAAIVFREVPGEEHMCLLVYTDTLPVAMHDALMRVLEGPVAQNSDSLADVLFRELFSDGRPMLQTLHAEGMLKKVQTKQVVVTPNASSHVNLEEMNQILREMNAGEKAIQRLAELDSNRGITGKVRPRDEFGREIGAPIDQVRQGSASVAGSDAARALDDRALASDLKLQAERMSAEAKGLLAESARLMKQAAELSGAVPESTAAAKPKRGRPAKSKAVADAAH